MGQIIGIDSPAGSNANPVESNMELSSAPNAAQISDQANKPLTTAVSLTPEADNQGFRHPMASQLASGNSRNTLNVKENVMSTKAKMHQTTVYDSGRGSRRDRKKKDEAKMSRVRVENMAANEACRVGQSRAIRNDLARLPGIRFAPCAEVNTGKYLDESMVKRVTGYDQ